MSASWQTNKIIKHKRHHRKTLEYHLKEEKVLSYKNIFFISGIVAKCTWITQLIVFLSFHLQRSFTFKCNTFLCVCAFFVVSFHILHNHKHKKNVNKIGKGKTKDKIWHGSLDFVWVLLVSIRSNAIYFRIFVHDPMCVCVCFVIIS